MASQHDLLGVLEVADQAPVELLGAAGLKYLPQIGQALAGVLPVELAGQQPARAGEEAVPGRWRGAGQDARPGRAQQPRHPLHSLPQALGQEVAVVAAKQLVPPVAGEAHRDLAARQLADQEGGYLRRIGERLVEHRRQAGHHGQGLLPGHVQFAVLGAQMGGHGPGVGGLVEPGLGKADGEGLDRPVAYLLHQGHHQRGIHPAGEEGPQGHVGDHAQTHRVGQQLLQLVGGGPLVQDQGRSRASQGHIPR